MSVQQTARKWQCPRCGRLFNGENRARRHVDESHNTAFEVQQPREVKVNVDNSETTRIGDWLNDGDGADLSLLTDAEREVYTAVERNGTGVREYARQTDRRPGTVGNLLTRARAKLEGDDE